MPYRSLYIHIPFCISKCVYCDFFSLPVTEVADDYVDALCNEIRFRLGDYGSEAIRTVYIGGGTPSLLSPAQIKKITGTIYASLSARSQIASAGGKSHIDEFTFELNPDDVTTDLLHALSDSGVTRLSCGIQSLNDDALSFCHRRANRAQVLHALDLFEKHWSGELSLDLISALPNETKKSFLEGLEIVTETKANHISLYSLTIEEETPLGKMIYGDGGMDFASANVGGGDCFANGKLDYDFDAADKMWLSGRDFLKRKGFSQYEVSNFCKDGKMSLHNLSYWNHESYIGCGSGACGTKRNMDGTSFRWTNTTDIKKYIDFWIAPKMPAQMGNRSAIVQSGKIIPQTIEQIDKQTSMFEFFMMGLRKLSGVNKSHFEQIFKTPFPSDVEKLFAEWERRGEATISGENYSLTESGILFLNKFLSAVECCGKLGK